MSFKHDSRGVNPDANWELLPEGLHTLKIIEAKEQVSSAGNNMVFIKCVPVNEPEHKNVEVWHWVVFFPKNPDGSAPRGAGMSVMFRKAIGVPYGGEDVVDAREWVGKKFSAYVKAEDYTNDKGTTITRNKIKWVQSLDDAKMAAEHLNPESKGGADYIPF